MDGGGFVGGWGRCSYIGGDACLPWVDRGPDAQVDNLGRLVGQLGRVAGGEVLNDVGVRLMIANNYDLIDSDRLGLLMWG